MEIELYKGKVTSNDNLHINDETVPTLYLLQFFIIILGLSAIVNGYKAAKIDEPLLMCFLLVVFFIDLAAGYYTFNRSTESNINFDDIKKVRLKNIFNIKNIVVLKLKNGKNRFIGNFKNREDAKKFIQFIESKIISKT